MATPNVDTQKQQEAYESILQMYDGMELLIDELEQRDDAENLMPFVKELLSKVEIAVNAISEEYAALVEEGRGIGGPRKKNMERAFKDYFDAIEHYKQQEATIFKSGVNDEHERTRSCPTTTPGIECWTIER